MIRHITILTIFFAIAILFISQPCLADSQKLTIVFTGDMRGEIESCHCPKEDFGGLPRRAKYIDEVRKETDDILLLDVGDVLSLFAPDFGKEEISHNAFISFKAMNIMGYDAMNVGESDIILGETFLKQKQGTLSFPLISANIVDRHTDEASFKPYVIKTMKNGLRVGLLGLVNERYILNSDKLDIAPNKEAASKFIPELKSKSDIVIVLGHLGLPYSIELAEAVKGIDVILSGHWDAESQKPMKIGNTLVMPTTYLSRRIGRLDLKIDKRGIYSYNWESTLLSQKYDGNKIVENLISKMPQPKTESERNSIQIERIALERPLRVLVFHSASCRACIEIKRELLPAIEKKYGDRITVEHYDIGVVKDYEQMIRLEKLYGVEGGYVPEVVVSRYVLMGKEEIISRLDGIIQEALQEEPDVKKNEALALQAVEYQPPARSLILSRFESFSIYTVLAAGLLDGINPCAFTTIVFFISFLAFIGYRKREMFFAGTSFTAAVFITYLLIGIGIFRFLRTLKAFGYIAYSINILIGALAFLLGALSLVDYFRFRKTKDAKATILKLPQSIKNRIHSVIGSDFRPGSKDGNRTLLKIIWIAFTAGFMVSVLESFCTGQVYLPTIAFVLRIPEKKISAFLYLILYNFAFIIPLIAVFLLGLLGATSDSFSRFMQKRLGLIKLSTAALFFTLGALLIIFR